MRKLKKIIKKRKKNWILFNLKINQRKQSLSLNKKFYTKKLPSPKRKKKS